MSITVSDGRIEFGDLVFERDGRDTLRVTMNGGPPWLYLGATDIRYLKRWLKDLEMDAFRESLK